MLSLQSVRSVNRKPRVAAQTKCAYQFFLFRNPVSSMQLDFICKRIIGLHKKIFAIFICCIKLFFSQVGFSNKHFLLKSVLKRCREQVVLNLIFFIRRKRPERTANKNISYCKQANFYRGGFKICFVFNDWLCLE